MIDRLSTEEALKNRIKLILSSENLDAQRAVVSSLAAALEIDALTFAAALLNLTQPIEYQSPPSSLGDQKTGHQVPVNNASVGIKMIRYRLDVGSKHRITVDQLKKVLVEESGVDKNNINHVNMHYLYTLIELPDEMPPDIFQHLKSVEINQQKLDIRRVKTRNKKRGSPLNRRGRKRDTRPVNDTADPIDGNSNHMSD
jgi:hypothetical protein